MKLKFKKWYRKAKGYIALSLAVLTLLYTSLVNFMFERAQADGANDRVGTFIKLAQGQSTNGEINYLEDLTEDELRFLGVYLSNFYIPFGTELGVTESEKNEEIVDQMVEALQNNMKFEEETAYLLAEKIMGLSRSNCKELKFYVGTDHSGENLVEVKNFKVNYFNFLRLMLGQYEAVFQGYDINFGVIEIPEIGSVEYQSPPISYMYSYPFGDEDIPSESIVFSWSNPTINSILHKDYYGENIDTGENYSYFYADLKRSGEEYYKYGYFCYEDEKGNVIPMFDCSFENEFTASQISFLQCLASVDISKGYGFSFFDFTSKEAEDSSELQSILSNLSESEVYNCSIYGTSMYVDCFGSIIQKGFNHQYIAVPGCMNPYTWKLVDEEGKDRDEASGKYYNLINFYSMSLADSGEFVLKDELLAERYSHGTMLGTPDLSNIRGKLQEIETSETIHVSGNWYADNSIGETREGFPLRVLRGSGEYKLQEIVMGTFTKDADFYSIAIKAQRGFQENNPEDFSYFASCNRTRDSEADVLPDFVAGDEDNGIDGIYGADDDLGNKYDVSSISCWYTDTIYNADSDFEFINQLVYIDNLGAYKFDSGGKSDFSVLNVDKYMSEDGTTPLMLESFKEDPLNGFVNGFSVIQSGSINSSINVSESATASLYSTYAIAGLYGSSSEDKKNTIGQLGFRINKEELVSIDNNAIEIPNNMESLMLEKQIRDWTYYLLHPTKGLDYVSLLIKNKTNALLVGWHNDMVGTNGVGAISGTTQYRSAIGFVTTPDLSEIQWTATLINLYNKIIPYLIVAMIVIMLFSYVAGILQIQKAIFGVIIFAVFLFIPVSLMSNAVSIGNSISQKIYSNKFTYWAVIQQESYVKKLDDAINAETYSNYLRELYAINNSTYANQGGDSIVLKWQAPKKMASLALTSKDQTVLDSLSNSRLLNLVLNTNTMSGEYYLNSDALYMYRSYTDLGNFSRFIYYGIDNGTKDSYSTVCTDNLNSSLQDSIAGMSSSLLWDVAYGYTNKSVKDLRLIKPMSSHIYNNALSQKGTIKDLTINDYVGLHQDLFNFDLAMFNVSDKEFVDTLTTNAKDRDGLVDIFAHYGSDVEKELSGLAAYGLMSESPYYYYSWCLYDMGMSTSSGAKGGYKSLLLGEEDGGFFYNLSDSNSISVSQQGTKEYYGNGELKDFMDMRSLFTYIIPYLKAGNDIVREWDDVYGIFIYEGVPTEEGHQNDPDILASPELQQKYWHNLNVARLYNIYSPWVDLMYDCSYAQPETITVMGEKYVVQDPINPASYPEARPMVFSESEMANYGLTEADLTEVERKILECNRQMEESMYELLNYYNFSDLTLNTSAAINCTFVFNSVFSETNLLGESINLYPQCFEISNFSYDAFLRFILANSLGEDLTNQEDFYMAVVEKSSTTTAIMYIISDICSQYALPAVKIFIIMLIFVSSILLILVTAFRVDPRQKFIPKLIKSLLVPMVSYLAINVGFAWILSLFMGTGNNAVTQSKQIVIQMGDPVIVMLIITALDLICIALYWKIIKNVWSDVKQNFSLAKSFVSGAIGGTFSQVGGFVSSKISNAKNGSSSSLGGSSYNETGSNKVSSRAAQRGSIDVAEGKHEESARINEATRETYRESKSDRNKKNSKEGTSRINNTIKSGSKKLGSNQEN